MFAGDRFKSPSYRVYGQFFNARVTSGSRTWTAELTWKDPSNAGPGSITTLDEASLRNKLENLDRQRASVMDALSIPRASSLRYVREAAEPTKAEAASNELDAKLLEQMRIDPKTSDAAYFNYCRKLGVKHQARPDFTAPAAVEQSPYTAQETAEINNAWLAHFMTKVHPELLEANHGEYNKSVLLQWHADEGLRAMTTDSLIRAHAECFTLQFFRTPLVGKRGYGNASSVRPYDRSEIERLRQENNELANPQPVQVSPERVKAMAKERVKQFFPQLRPGTREYELKIDEVLLSWARQDTDAGKGNPNLGTRKTVATVSA